MPLRARSIAVLILGAAVLAGPAAAAAQEPAPFYRIHAGIEAEAGSRMVVWDKDAGSSFLKSIRGRIRFGLELSGGASFSLLAGGGAENWNGLIFRHLPFSVDYEAGSRGAIVLGAEMEVPLFRPGDWEIGAAVQALFSLGLKGEWTSEALQQPARLSGRASGTAVRLGPTLAYRGFETFTPIASVFYDGLWSSFTMEETIGSLSGSEKKKINGRGSVGASLGMIIEPSASFRLKAEGFLIPGKKLEGGWNLSPGAAARMEFLF